MFRILLLDYYQTKIDEITAQFALAREDNIDGVHDLRVALKRFKAFYNLVGAIGNDFNGKKRFRPFKTIAGTAGALRDAHVQIELLDETNAALCLELNGYSAFLKSIESDAFDRFRTFAETDPLDSAAEAGSIVSRAIEKVSAVRAETMAQGRFYNLRNSLVLTGSGANIDEKSLHTVRILAKELHYTFEILQQCFHYFEDRADFIAEIKKVHQALGKWHDYDVMLVHLDDFFKSSGESSVNDPYKILVSAVNKEKSKLFKKFSGVIGGFNTIALTL